MVPMKACRICRTQLDDGALSCFSCGAVLEKRDVASNAISEAQERRDIVDRKPIAFLLVTIFFALDAVVLLFMLGLSEGRRGVLIGLGVTAVCWIAALYCVGSKRLGIAYALALFLVPAFLVVGSFAQWASRFI